jgi:hypothetical protein
VTTFADLPLFASDAELAKALLGGRSKDWPLVVHSLERMGLPPVDPTMRGRYTPAVKSFLDRIYNPSAAVGAAPPGAEKVVPWPNSRRL